MHRPYLDNRSLAEKLLKQICEIKEFHGPRGAAPPPPNKIDHRDPSSWVTTVNLRAGSRNTTIAKSQFSIRSGRGRRSYSRSSLSGRDCVRERL